MRTHILVDAKLVRRARKLTGPRTNRAVVEEALRRLMQLQQQKRVRSLRGRIQWQGDLVASREGRNGGA
jgi:Arc/MetJ family transcription regulator